MYQATEKGFILERGGVSFCFTDARSLDGGEFLLVEGEAPIPELICGDRILVPIGEGIALTVGEADPILNAGGSFCSKQGTMRMVMVERGGKYLLIRLDSGVYASYSTKPVAEGGTYHLSRQGRKPCGVHYERHDS